MMLSSVTLLLDSQYMCDREYAPRILTCRIAHSSMDLMFS